MEPEDEQTKIMTAKEVSERLRISLSTVHHLTRTGKIRGMKMGKQWRYVKEDIERCLAGGFDMAFSGAKSRAERRRNARLNCHIGARAAISLDTNSNWSGDGIILNLSEGGLLFETTNTQTEKRGGLQLNDPITVRLRIPAGAQEMNLNGRIVHMTQAGSARIGIKFRNLSPESQKLIQDYID